MIERVFVWLVQLGLQESTAVWLGWGLLVLLLLLTGWVSYLLVRLMLRRLTIDAARQSANHWDDVLLEFKVIQRLALLVPAGLLSWLVPYVLDGPGAAEWLTIFKQLLTIYGITLIVLILWGLVNALSALTHRYDFAHELPISSLGQVLKIAAVLIGGLLLVATLFGQNPLTLLGGLSALAAVLSFVYQDALRGLVAGIQLTGNKLLARGDVIEVPAHNAVGTVEEIGLTTIKVKNADFTITSVPTYALISGSFKNWRGLEQGEGRRIKQALLLDANTIKYCDETLWERLNEVELLATFIKAHSPEEGVQSTPFGQVRPTNLAALRAYLTAYLQGRPDINQDLTLLVRPLEPTPLGLPLELYAFSREKDWTIYEMIQADIFDHVLAVIPEFDLRLYQSASDR